MSKLPWSTWEAVGDQSEYVTQIVQILTNDVPVVAHMLSPAYHSYFCNQVASQFAPRYEEYIFKCKRICEMGAQQLSLDAHALKSVILEVPQIGGDQVGAASRRRGAARAFTRMVNNAMGRIEGLLKVLISPPDLLIPTYKTILSKGSLSSAGEVLVKVRF